MSYFHTPTAEYRAKRIAQMMAHAGEHHVFAMRDGRTLVNFKGHLHLFNLDTMGNLIEVDHVDIQRPKQTWDLTESPQV